VELDTITYNAAVGACEQGYQWATALRLFMEMASARVQLDTITYKAAVSACENCGECDHALRLLAEMVCAEWS